MLNRKDTIVHLTAEFFPEPKSLGKNVKVELGLPNYETKPDLEYATGIDTLDYAKNTDLGNLKSDVDQLDTDKFKNIKSNLSNLRSKENKLGIGKLETTLVDLSKLSDAVKKTEYDELVKKVNAIETTDSSNLIKKID